LHKRTAAKYKVKKNTCRQRKHFIGR